MDRWKDNGWMYVKWMDGQMYVCKDGQIVMMDRKMDIDNGWIDVQTDGQMDGWKVNRFSWMDDRQTCIGGWMNELMYGW